MNCPICGGHIDHISTTDSAWFANKYYNTVEGNCSDCGKAWRWIEVYTLDHCEDMEEIDINDHL